MADYTTSEATNINLSIYQISSNNVSNGHLNNTISESTDSETDISNGHLKSNQVSVDSCQGPACLKYERNSESSPSNTKVHTKYSSVPNNRL